MAELYTVTAEALDLRVSGIPYGIKQRGDIIWLTNGVARQFVRDKLIAPYVPLSHTRLSTGAPANPDAPVTLRIAFFQYTSPQYSGGRVYMFQLAHTLATMGAEVWLCTNDMPRWADNYPPANINVVANAVTLPVDVDVVITDSKTDYGNMAYEFYRQSAPRAAFLCVNFETENWMRDYVPELAQQYCNQRPQIFAQAHHFIAISHECLRTLKEWDGIPDAIQGSVIYPVSNEHAVAKAANIGWAVPRHMERPYAVVCGRNAGHKQIDVAIDAVWALDIPFDVVGFGGAVCRRRGTELHQFHDFGQKNDVTKFAYMHRAHMVLAPSLFEGYGIVPGEALCTGTPVIVYDLPVLREAYRDRPGITWVPWNDRTAFAKAVADVAHAPKPQLEWHKTLGELGSARMRDGITKCPYINMRRKVFATCLVYWGFVPESIESVLEVADEVLVAAGRVDHAPQIDDGSMDRLQTLARAHPQIKVEWRNCWPSKEEMQQWCCDHATGNYLVQLGGDEVWVRPEAVLTLADGQFTPRFVNFWHGPDYYVTDAPCEKGRHFGNKIAGQEGSCFIHYRGGTWRRSYVWRNDSWPLTADRRRAIFDLSTTTWQAAPTTWVAHLGYALPKSVMDAKMAFYLSRDGDTNERRDRILDYAGWKGGTGTLTRSVVHKAPADLPDIVRRAFDSAAKIGVRA